jgi:hypothetical protein
MEAEFAKLTDEMEGDYVKCVMRTGEAIYAPMINIGTASFMPSKKWLTANKDNFIALITYERNYYSNPLIIGFYPVKDAKMDSFNTLYMIEELLFKLVEQLGKAKINTQLGPQQFMPDTLVVLDEIKQSLTDTMSNVLKLEK